MNFEIIDDEPSVKDALNRENFVEALAQVSRTCSTPLVLGLYGTWGVGKTSLMKQIKSTLDEVASVRTIWFDPWQHQFDEDPAIALLHTMVDDLKLGEEGRKLLTIIAGALGSVLLKAATTINISDIQKLGESYEEERFQVREKQIRLRHHFRQLIERASENGQRRLVFFIDDLDRCIPGQILKVLEALKLYLNLPGCVYLLGVDRSALEGCIKQRYSESDLSEAAYLDKIVQLPFTIPPIAENAMEDFINSLIPSDLHSIAQTLIRGLGDNPRQIKRFVNTFLLNHQLASTMIQGSYSPKFLAGVLIVQYRNPELFKLAIRNPNSLVQISSGKIQDYSELIGDDAALIQVIKETGFNSEDDVLPYVYLSEVASVRNLEFDVLLTDIGEKKINIIKEIREFTRLGLKEAKDLVESAPMTIATGLSKEQAEEFKAKLEHAGAKVEIR